MIGALAGLHALAALVWVGGMFFAHVVLRPSVAEMPPSERLRLWRGVFPRFFLWVWIAVPTLLVTGYGLTFAAFGGMAGLPWHVNAMQGTGWLMIILYAWMFTGPFQSFKRSLAAGDLPVAAGHQATIRHVVTVNLVLGLFTSFIGASRGTLG